jgi:phenylalanyl-tRNA synthetase beta chain
MRVPLSWLREWVRVADEPAALARRLSGAGFEVEGIESAAPAFSNVVVGEIVSAARHPEADKLSVCQVSAGSGAPLQIVCGAANARAGLRAPLAHVGAVLPGDLRIRAARLRGVESHGMLCSANELGLADSSEGLLELAGDAPIGADLRAVLDLDDTILTLNITPNRGDAMSVLGVAREVAALTGASLSRSPVAPVPATVKDEVAVALDEPQAAPRFVGRVVRGIDNTRRSPAWLVERLRRAGVRSISPAVDVTNCVLLELGQPMHAYDLAALRGTVRARFARAGEHFVLLDEREVTPAADELVIADDAGPVGLAGVMGGARTAVQTTTRDVFLEVAYFAPAAIQGRARRHGLVTDASQRFERGVDPTGQERAIERATRLLLDIAGGEPGPVRVVESHSNVPRRPSIRLRRARLARLLGTRIDDATAAGALAAFGIEARPTADGWEATAPAHRFDLAIEADLIEEIARHVGYGSLPAAPASAVQRICAVPGVTPDPNHAIARLAARGYDEAITFAFVDPVRQAELLPDARAVKLANPIASDLAVMRVSLWPGLLRAAGENVRRQQDRVRLVEHGVCFLEGDAGVVTEVDRIAGVVVGARYPEQWGADREAASFFDVKADVTALLEATGEATAFRFVAASRSCLHPGRAARIERHGVTVGWLGELHPERARSMDLTVPPILFELDVAVALRRLPPRFSAVSRFPQVRRDLAIVVDADVSLSAVTERVTLVASNLLRDLRVFDVYQGAGVESGRKSIALGLIFQDNSRTLTDEDVEGLMGLVVADLGKSLNARIRE